MKSSFAHNAAIALLTITAAFFTSGASAQRVPVHRAPGLTGTARRPVTRTPGNFDGNRGIRNDRGFGRQSPTHSGNFKNNPYHGFDPRGRH